MSVIALVGFLAVVLTVLSLMHLYIWWRAVRSTTRAGGRGRRIGTSLIVVAFLLTAGAQAGSRVISAELAAPLAWVGFSWVGFAWYFFLFLIVGELIRLGARLLGNREGSREEDLVVEAAPVVQTEPLSLPAADPGDGGGVRTEDRPAPPGGPPARDEVDESRAVTRRLFLSRSIALGAGVAAAGLAGYGMTRALGDPVVRRVPVSIYGLDPRLAGFRITLFGDAHLGAIRRRGTMEALVDTINATEPDLVAVVGDLIDGSVADLGDDVAPMSRLASSHGTFFVTGNHEYYSGVQEWVDYLPDLGVRVLRNERLTIERDGAAFDLAGVNDITGEQYGDVPDYGAALDGRPDDRPVVLLSHQPVTIDRAVGYGVDLQLSAHTHGGQLWPFHYIVAAQQGAVSGLSRIQDTQLYVNNGVGFWGPPMRVGADPEVTVIELQPQDRII